MVHSDYPRLVQVLERVLLHTGFWRFPYMDYFVRVRGDVRDVIGWRQDQHTEGDARRYAVYFGVWVPEFEGTLKRADIDETVHIQNMEFMHELLPQAMPKSPFWWAEDEVTSHTEALLRRQVTQVAMPYFETFASFGDVAEIVYYDQRYHNSALEQRLMNHPDAPFFHYEIEQASEQVVQALKPLQKLAPAFQYSNGVFWRQRGDIFDAIVPHYFANWRFVQIRTMVWHPELDGMAHTPALLPAGFSHVAWRSFNEQGKDASLLPPAFLGERTTSGLAPISATKAAHTCDEIPITLESQLEGLRTYGLAWLESVCSRQDVFNAVRTEFKPFYPD